MSETGRIFFAALFTLAAGYALGRLITSRLPLPETARLAAGVALFSHSVLLLLALRIGRTPVFLLWGAVLLALAVWRTPPGKPHRPRPPHFVAAIVGLYGFIYLVHALAPEIQPDGYTYHLGLPAEWLRSGALSSRIGFYEMLPHGAEMLFASAIAFGGYSAAKVLHFGFLAATLPLMAALGRRLGLPENVSWIGATLYFCAPVVGVAGTAAYNDAMLVFFFLATLYLLLAWRQEGLRGYLPLLGLTAGFCYAIKPTGIIAAPAAVAAVALRRRREAWLVAAGAALMMAPWMVRNALRTGNPVAPLANRFFPNPHFHISTEMELTRSLRSYEGVSWRSLPVELTMRGRRLQGAIGPVFLLAPLILLRWRRRELRWLLGAALVLATPCFLNIGARFFMPALALLALALAAALPQRLAVACLAGHALLCLPPVAAAWTEPGAWRLQGLPWRAALRLEAERDYLRRMLWEYRAAEMVETNVAKGARVLDLAGLPNAYLTAEAVAAWQSARTDRLGYALQIANHLQAGVYSDIQARWPAMELSAVRFLQTAPSEQQWGIAEVSLEVGSSRIALPPQARLLARPNVWEAPFAFDRNLISRWGTWEPARPGMYLGVDFGTPLRLDGARLTVLTHEQPGDIRVEGRPAGGDWRDLAASLSVTPRPAMNLRLSATRLLRQEGFHYVVAPLGETGYAPVGRSMRERPAEWGLELLAEAEGLCLFQIRGQDTQSPISPPR